MAEQRDERTGEVRVLREIKLEYLSLDLHPGPYGSIPQVIREERMGQGA